jgi:membrane protein YqaA with SNARE-associated domain
VDPLSIAEFSGPETWLYFFVIVLLTSATPLPIFATEAIVFAAGSLADPLLIGIIAGLAGAIGELSTYFIGYGGERLISKKKKEGKRYNRAEEIFQKYGFWAVILFAFTPLPMDLLGLIAGGLRYNLKRFFIGTLIGKIPRFILMAYAGAGLIPLAFAL